MEKYNLELSQEEIFYMVGLLLEQPAKNTMNLILKINEQVQKQEA